MPEEHIPIRLSHLLGHSGVGAIVRGNDGLMVIQDIRRWTDRNGHDAGRTIPYVERVKAALNIHAELREPPVGKTQSNGVPIGACIPATRFPYWVRCPACGKLSRSPWRQHPATPWPAHCSQQGCSGAELEQVTWVVAHRAGYLSDVPWHFLAHAGSAMSSQTQCKVTDQLRLRERGHENDLSCGACGARARFRGDERVRFSRNQRQQPWTTEDLVRTGGVTDREEADLAQVLAINDSRVYSPAAESVLVIPPESRVRKGTVVDRLYRHSADRARVDHARSPLARKAAIRTLAAEYRCEPQDIEDALSDLSAGYPLYGENPTPGQLRESEFDAFLEVLHDQRDDEDLVTRNLSDAWRRLSQTRPSADESNKRLAGIQDLVRVDRLKSVRVFRGFTRLGGEVTTPPDIVSCTNWLPAIELYGEGIFLTLDPGRLVTWEEHPAVQQRFRQILPRFIQSGRDEPNPLTPRFLLLHTLSHLLMRQIESEGGYPAASLIERLYCAHSPRPMAGILIHVAVPDIAGSLGGLAELAEPAQFAGILTRALEHAQWCSLDPVCNEHEGQGPGLLNRAACHACALVPEPACECGNTLLDRCFVKGDVESGLPSFFEMP